MTDDTDPAGSNDIIATIGNKEDPTQNIDIRYLSDENAFVTSGIKLHFWRKGDSDPFAISARGLSTDRCYCFSDP